MNVTDDQALVRQANAERSLALIDATPTHASLAMSFDDMRHRVVLLNDFYKIVMQAGTDYDVIPGTPKPSLFQPGAQLLDGIFGLVPKFTPVDVIRDYDKGFFAYEVRCSLIQKQTGEVAAEALGSCNSMEGRYRWRDAKPECPQCGFELRTSKQRPEWYCWKTKGGCGATYPLEQFKAAGRVENDDPYTLANTILKMAQKRAHVAATLNATGASRIFTQDVEDMTIDIEPSPPPVRRNPPPRSRLPEDDPPPADATDATLQLLGTDDDEPEQNDADAWDFGRCYETWEHSSIPNLTKPLANQKPTYYAGWHRMFTLKSNADTPV